MGLTRFSGPVYGAKGVLTTFISSSGTQNTSTADAFVNARHIVPVGEDWFICEAGLSLSTTSSSAQSFLLKTEGGSSGILRLSGQLDSTKAQTVTTWATTTSTTLAWTLNIVTPTPGAYEGLYVPSGSTVRLVSSGSAGPGLPYCEVYGFRRFVSSTRAEG